VESKYYYSYDANGKITNQKYFAYDYSTKKLYYSTNTDFFYSLFVDTKDIQTIAFSIYPNPSSEVIVIKTNDAILSSTIYDANGRLLSITNGDFSDINIADLANGTYFLQVKTQTGMGTTQFIKK
jgi:hypothetical protein